MQQPTSQTPLMRGRSMYAIKNNSFFLGLYKHSMFIQINPKKNHKILRTIQNILSQNDKKKCWGIIQSWLAKQSLVLQLSVDFAYPLVVGQGFEWKLMTILFIVFSISNFFTNLPG